MKSAIDLRRLTGERRSIGRAESLGYLFSFVGTHQVKIFVSWSGPRSKAVAELFCDWIKDVLQGATTWMSKDDIDKGSIWFNEIASQLADTTAGVLCLTRQNRNAAWVLFEAGALSKGLSSSRVCPILIDLTISELETPLSQLNCTLPHRDDMLELIKDINKFSQKASLDVSRVEKAFEKWWPDFEKNFEKILTSQKPQEGLAKRETSEVLEEILQVVRSLQKTEQERVWIDLPVGSTPRAGFSGSAVMQATGQATGGTGVIGRSRTLLEALTNEMGISPAPTCRATGLEGGTTTW